MSRATSASTEVFQRNPNVFLQSIYGGTLGRLRVAQILDDLQKYLERDDVGTVQHIVDVGAGDGRVVLELLAMNPRLSAVLIEPSEMLLGQAREIQLTLGVADERVAYVAMELEQALGTDAFRNADLILSHAVANWTKDPWRYIEDLTSVANANGSTISLVVGASRGKVARYVYHDDIASALSLVNNPHVPVSSQIGKEYVCPLDPVEVMSLIIGFNCEVLDRAGIRIFADFAPKSMLQNQEQYDKLEELERVSRRDKRYWHLGQLAHFIYR